MRGLVDRGHRVIFMLDRMYKGQLAPLGFEEHIFNEAECSENDQMKPGEATAALFEASGVLGPASPLDKMRQSLENRFKRPSFLQSQVELNRRLADFIDRYRPDVVIHDMITLPPAIHYSEVPWVKMVTMTPAYRYIGDDIPPPGSGMF